MSKPFGYNAPQGVDAESFLSDELITMLEETFVGVTDAFGDDATLYRIDIGKIIESAKAGGLIISGQFVDKSDGEIFNFAINQDSNKLSYNSAGEFLDEDSLAVIHGEPTEGDTQGDTTSEVEEMGQKLYDLIFDAVNDTNSQPGQSPFGIQLSKDLDSLAVLSAVMFHAGITIEAQPLYAGLHDYAIKYAHEGLKLFSGPIGAMEGPEAAAMTSRWINEKGLEFTVAFIKVMTTRRCEEMREQIQGENQPEIEHIKALLEEAIAMAMACTIEMIKWITSGDEYEEGDVQTYLAFAIDEFCPIDNTGGYYVSLSPRQLSSEWQEVVKQSGCTEDLSMEALGLPTAQTITNEEGRGQTQKPQTDAKVRLEDDQNPDSERIFYVNVGEGPSRNWDDCRKFGFLAAGGGRKWSKQLEKIKTGDTVIAYLKGYGYVGIGKVTTRATPATKFMVNGVSIKELPLINDTIRSIKRFSKENGEYLIGIDWEVAVPREKAAWKANAGLYTTALVCASLSNQPDTIAFTLQSLKKSQDEISLTNEDRPSLLEDTETDSDGVPYINGSSYYNPNDYGWDILESFSFPPGKYFLGDPCHALSEDEYQQACGICYNSCGVIDDVGRIAVFKCSGDGFYKDEDGRLYTVSSGTLGIVPLRHADEEKIRSLNKLGIVLDAPGESTNPNWEDDGEGLVVMIDSQGHIWLGCAWIFCGDEHPLKAEFTRLIKDHSHKIDDDFWPSDVTKAVLDRQVYYYGYCEFKGEEKCFIIRESAEKLDLFIGSHRQGNINDEHIAGYPDPAFQEKWIELSNCKGMSCTI